MEKQVAGRLTREDWIRAALEILLEHGVAGVKITVIASRMGVTSGSFYWHFKGLPDLLDCLLEYWEIELTDRIVEHAQAFNGPPDQRILALMTQVIEFDAAVPDHAILVWSRHEPRVKEVFDRTLQKRFDFAAWMFREAGFAKRDATIRGRMMVAYLMGESSADLKSNRTWKSIIRKEFEVLTHPGASAG